MTSLTTELSFPRSVTAEGTLRYWSGVAAALSVGHTLLTRPWCVAETIAEPGVIRHLIHAPTAVMPVIEQQLTAQLPGVRWQRVAHIDIEVEQAVEVRLSSPQRSLRVDRAEAVSSAILMALASVNSGERLVLQWVLGGSPPARAVHRPVGMTTVAELHEIQDVDRRVGDRARELRGKALEPQLFGVCRIGVTSEQRAELLIRGVLGALRGSDAPGVRSLVRTMPGKMARDRLRRRLVPWRFPAVYNGAELAGRVAFPINGPQVPGLTLGGSRLLVLSRQLSTNPAEGAVLASATFPGMEHPVVLRDRDRLEHLYINGPTGVGKSTLLARIAAQDIEHDHAVIVIEPRGDLVDDIIDRIPPRRVRDVIVLDPADSAAPVGYNPLAAVGRSLDLISDSITSVFGGLFSQYWGPRTDDVLRSCLMTLGLAQRPEHDGFTLCEIPVLLTDPAFRKTVTAGLNDPIALEPFWAVYEGLRPAERSQVIAPLLNKLRAFLLRQSLRAMLGQSEPKWSIERVMAERKILLVPLRAGVVGEEAAQLFGSLVVSRIWQATLGRSAMSRGERTPVMVIIDEFHTLVHSEASLGDLLAQARGHGVALTLAHQHLGQLSPEMQRDVLANARSKVLFQQGIEDARRLARGLPELEPEDLQGLPSREVVMSIVTNAEVQPAVTGKTLPLESPIGSAEAARRHSRTSYGVDPAVVEDAMSKRRFVEPKPRRRTTTAKAGEQTARRRPVIGEVPDEEASS